MTNKPTTRKRYNILAMVFVTVVINYLDRSNISVAAFALSEELKLDSILQIPGGIMADKIKTRILYPFIMAFWSIATLFQGLAGVVVSIVIGYLVKDGDFKPALFFTGGIALLSFVSYTFIVGKVVRIVPKE